MLFPRRRVPWLVATAVILAWLLAMMAGDRWAVLANGWPMSLAMVGGAFVAGSSMLGGGAVAFPVATLVFALPPDVARDFSLAIQAVGMTAASVTIIALRIPVAWRVLRVVAPASAAGVVLGWEVLAPALPRPLLILGFAALLAAFGVVLVWLQQRRVALPADDAPPRQGVALCALVGLIGGLISGVLGTGADFVLFALLVLGLGVSERIATPTSVMVMALTSLCAVLWANTVGGGLAPQAWSLWWACVPVVVVFAPLGAWVVSRWPRRRIVLVLVSLIAVQFAAAVLLVPRGPVDVAICVGVLALGVVGFWALALWRRWRGDVSCVPAAGDNDQLRHQ